MKINSSLKISWILIEKIVNCLDLLRNLMTQDNSLKNSQLIITTMKTSKKITNVVLGVILVVGIASIWITCHNPQSSSNEMGEVLSYFKYRVGELGSDSSFCIGEDQTYPRIQYSHLIYENAGITGDTSVRITENVAFRLVGDKVIYISYILKVTIDKYGPVSEITNHHLREFRNKEDMKEKVLSFMSDYEIGKIDSSFKKYRPGVSWTNVRYWIKELF